MSSNMSREDMVWSHNEWMRRYIEEPETFTAEFRAVMEFVKSEEAGEEPNHGEECTAYMEWLVANR